ncbi:MAG: hypothetical protein ABSF12_04060 [Bryobacteraceae bacterium]|jgi:hypothetical protein
MKHFLKILVLITSAGVVLAQGNNGHQGNGGSQGNGGFNGNPGNGGQNGWQGGPTDPTPATPEQLATREVNRISTTLRLNTTETSALLADLACTSSETTVTVATPCALTAEQNVLQANAATLKTDWATLATDLSSTPPASTTATVGAINGLQLSDLEARVAAAGAVLTELATLKVTLTSTQQTNLTNLLVRGSRGPGGFRR